MAETATGVGDLPRDVGEYRLLRLLGKGGMSEVYEAEHRRLGSRHAVKFFFYDGAAEDVRERFLAEGRILSRLAHPRIVRVTDVGEDAGTGRPYFVMDLVTDPGGNVRSLADVPAGEADEEQIASWYEDLREGLAYIHAKGIVHRDLKLENVLVGADGHVVLVDFGISKIVDKDGAVGTAVDHVQTVIRLRDGKRPLMGSIGYMAPELEMGVAASAASDWYALGVIVFRLLTGMWCDSRTDVTGDLETYDPVWRQILPKLLHANPQGRECPSWRDLKKEQEERRLFEMESKLEAESRNTRMAKLLMWGVSAVSLVIMVVAIACGGKMFQGPPLFEDVVVMPPNVPVDSRDEYKDAMKDAWDMLHDTFTDLRKRRITGVAAAAAVRKAAETHITEGGGNEDDELYKLLDAAAERMKERYPEK